MTYLDNNSTTNPSSVVREFIQNLISSPLNPSSVHKYGRGAKAIIENARMQILEALSIKKTTRAHQVVFTSSGTEANNQIMNSFNDSNILISSIEHLSIFAHSKSKSNITLIKVDKNGVLDLIDLEDKLIQFAKEPAKPTLVSVMLANNESGVIQPIPAIANIVTKYNAILHSDIVQAVGRITVDFSQLGADLVTISGHKFGGLAGAGAIIGTAKAMRYIKPLIIGGGQERGLRSGTENVLSIAAMGAALEIAINKLEENAKKTKKLQNFLEEGLNKRLPYAIIASKDAIRLPNTTLILVPGQEAQKQLIKLDLKDIQVSSGSACSSGKIGASHVLLSMGFKPEIAGSAIRVSTSPENTEEDIRRFLEIFTAISS